ncbi:hypothetical protein [Singulisphaera sp. PoT]|uniref:hypothetical protein n=1 Tax=Singulisphaera sp. PoT TaxID=3411797 RepID=UPI003BF5760D
MAEVDGMAINPLLFKYKGNLCAACGLSVDEMMRKYGVVNKLFQFNHTDPSAKHPEYDKLMQRVISSDQLNEVDKCVLLCSGCHIILHGQNISADFTITVRMGGRTAVLNVKAQVIHNKYTNQFTCFTEKPLFLYPYAVRRGDLKPSLMTGFELHDGRLLDYMLETKNGKPLEISVKGGAIMFRAEKIDDQNCRVLHHSDFPLLSLNVTKEDGSFDFSVRNGQTIYNSKNEMNINPEPAFPMYESEMTYDSILTAKVEFAQNQGKRRSTS